jgi:hypothetical protein
MRVERVWRVERLGSRGEDVTTAVGSEKLEAGTEARSWMLETGKTAVFIHSPFLISSIQERVFF